MQGYLRLTPAGRVTVRPEAHEETYYVYHSIVTPRDGSSSCPATIVVPSSALAAQPLRTETIAWIQGNVTIRPQNGIVKWGVLVSKLHEPLGAVDEQVVGPLSIRFKAISAPVGHHGSIWVLDPRVSGYYRSQFW